MAVCRRQGDTLICVVLHPCEVAVSTSDSSVAPGGCMFPSPFRMLLLMIKALLLRVIVQSPCTVAPRDLEVLPKYMQSACHRTGDFFSKSGGLQVGRHTQWCPSWMQCQSSSQTSALSPSVCQLPQPPCCWYASVAHPLLYTLVPCKHVA